MSKLVATMWACGDDDYDGGCYQPQIYRTTPHPRSRGFVLRESVWRGTFVNEPEPGQLDGLVEELREAASRFGIELAEEPGTWPFGAKDEALGH